MSVLRLLLFLLTLAAIYAIGLSVLAFHGYAARPEASATLWGLEFQTLLALWVRTDRRTRNLLNFPFEFEAFVFFAWPVAVPYYLYRTRDKGSLIGATAAIYVLYVAPAVISNIVATVARLSAR